MMAMKIIVRDSEDKVHEFDCTAEPFCDVRSMHYDSDTGTLDVVLIKDMGSLGKAEWHRQWKNGEWKTLQVLP